MSVCDQGAIFLFNQGVVTRVCVWSKVVTVIRCWLFKMPMLYMIIGLP